MFFIRKILKIFYIFVILTFLLSLLFISGYYYKNNIYKDKNFSIFINFKDEKGFVSGYILYFLLDRKKIYTFFIDKNDINFKKFYETDIKNFMENFKIDYFFLYFRENIEYINDNFLSRRVDLTKLFIVLDGTDMNVMSRFENFNFFIRNLKILNVIKNLRKVSFSDINFKSFFEQTNMNFIDLIELFLKMKRQNFFKNYFKVYFFKYKEGFSYDDIDEIINKKIAKNYKKDDVLEVLNSTYKSGLSVNVTRKLRKNYFDVENFGNYTNFLNYTYIIDRKGNIDILYKLYNYINDGFYISFPKQENFYDVKIVLGENSDKIFLNK